MRRLVLHIGYFKAGSTSIQSYCLAHRQQLSQQGILFPVQPGNEVNKAHANLAMSLLDQSFPASRRFDPQRLTFPKLSEQLKTTNEDVVILSSEAFVHLVTSPESIAALETFAFDNDLTVDVIVFLRPQHLLINSRYTEKAKALRTRQCFVPFLRKQVDYPPLQYDAHLKPWKGSSRMRLVPVPFTHNRLKPDLMKSFFTAANLEKRIATLLRTNGIDIANTSPGPMTLRACLTMARRLGGRRHWSSKGLGLEAGRKLARRLCIVGKERGWDDIQFNGLDNRRRDLVQDRFSASNNKLAQRYWSADWEEIFYEDYKRDFAPNELRLKDMTPEDVQIIERLVKETAREENVDLD